MAKKTGKSKGHENLIPWKPGQSGNPKGRKPMSQRCKEYIDEMGIDKLIEFAESKSKNDVRWALDRLFDRAYGKSLERKEVDDKRSVGENPSDVIAGLSELAQEVTGENPALPGDTEGPTVQ